MDRGPSAGESSNKRGKRSWDGNSDVSNKGYFDKIVRGGKIVESEVEAVRFLTGAAEGEAMSVVFDLTDKSKQGATSLRRALSLACTPSSMDQVVKFLAFLGADVLNKGAAKTCTTQCFMTAFETPGFLESIEEAIKADRIRDTGAVMWFLLSVSRTCASARENAQVQSIANLLSEKPGPWNVQLATLLVPGKIAADMTKNTKDVALDLSKVESYQELHSYQPQHNNDFPLDYRKIAIVPTAEELNTQRGDAGIQTMGMIQAKMVPEARATGDEAALAIATVLDRKFRLLREDMIAPTKDELKEEWGKRPRERRKLFDRPRVVGWELDPKPCVLVRVEATPALKCKSLGCYSVGRTAC